MTKDFFEISEATKAYAQELVTFNQSVQFYQSIQTLIDMGYLVAQSGKDDVLTRVKVECTITEKQAYSLAKDLQFDFYNHLYKPNI